MLVYVHLVVQKHLGQYLTLTRGENIIKRILFWKCIDLTAISLTPLFSPSFNASGFILFWDESSFSSLSERLDFFGWIVGTDAGLTGLAIGDCDVVLTGGASPKGSPPKSVLSVGAEGKLSKVGGGGKLTLSGSESIVVSGFCIFVVCTLDLLVDDLNNSSSSSSSNDLTGGIIVFVSVVGIIGLAVGILNDASWTSGLVDGTTFGCSAIGPFDLFLVKPNISSSLSSSDKGADFLTGSLVAGGGITSAAGCCTDGLSTNKGSSSSDILAAAVESGLAMNRSSSELGDLGFVMAEVVEGGAIGFGGVFLIVWKISSSSLSPEGMGGFRITGGWIFWVGSVFVTGFDGGIFFGFGGLNGSSSSSLLSSNISFSFFGGIIVDDVELVVVGKKVGICFGASLKKSSPSSSIGAIDLPKIDGLEI